MKIKKLLSVICSNQEKHRVPIKIVMQSPPRGNVEEMTEEGK